MDNDPLNADLLADAPGWFGEIELRPTAGATRRLVAWDPAPRGALTPAV